MKNTKIAVKVLKSLSDETRLKIYLLLLKEELCVCEITNILGIEQSHASHCLKILKEANLVKCRKTGTWVIYSINTAFKKSKLIEAIKAIPLSSTDIKRLERCKKNKIRESCNTFNTKEVG